MMGSNLNFIQVDDEAERKKEPYTADSQCASRSAATKTNSTMTGVGTTNPEAETLIPLVSLHQQNDPGCSVGARLQNYGVPGQQD